MKTIYRGCDLEQHDGEWIISENGKELYIAKSEAEAVQWVNEEKRTRRLKSGS